MNRHTKDTLNFFLIALEVLRISDSLPAVVFRLAASPNAWAKTTAASSEKPMSDNASLYQKFFQGLIDDLREKHGFTNARAGQPQNWYSFSTGKQGIAYTATFAARDRLRAEVYIDVGDQLKNKAIFEYLRANENLLATEIGEPLVWEKLEEKRASRISVVRENTSIAATAEHDEEIRRWLIQRLLKLKEVFGPHLRLAVEASGVQEPITLMA